MPSKKKKTSDLYVLSYKLEPWVSLVSYKSKQTNNAVDKKSGHQDIGHSILLLVLHDYNHSGMACPSGRPC